MITNENIYDVILCENLIECGTKMVQFADKALIENNKATIIKNFYDRLIEYAVPSYAFDFYDKPYAIIEGRHAIPIFMLTNLPNQQTPIKTLKNIKALGEYLSEKYMEPVGPRISQCKTEEIILYLDKKFDFINRVFKDKKPMFLLIDHSHADVNSECYIALSKEGQIIQHIFLYHMRTNNMETPMPESVLFHELGHAIHARISGISHRIPDQVMNFLEHLWFPSIKSITNDEQCEVFADVMSIGMMYNSPFSIYNPLPQIYESDQKEFNKLFQELISNM